ncbi:DNA mismatch repair endonuclease MutL [Dokdonia sp. Dokd-P16]|uniref:DNA mismatch repair endonuclease MutL n=1 Tax=Dokdonia sp. Dokd-P16 TaxID=2173169 RepID=UPI000D5446B4|nr:DNA mismatch repair endonuclease MutL [Dokdonia sp. Dokd-P16]AWH74429.1 DNA mismatch repair endonuclease MutL [Dokdonia sp. Dokd-P16]
MADIIKLLPDHVANQIAAGEVVQRPASVVKELLENAIDAGASTIKLIVKDAGKTLIQIIDDGKGMSDTDARMSFERHATSKITTADDLFNLNTKGFRGEALASIAAVAHVELKTRPEGAEVGTRIEIEGSKINAQEVCATPKGTSLSVKNLFFNIPARRNFLKSNSVELRHVIDEFQRVSLAHPDIAFAMYHNEGELFQLPQGNLKQRIVAIFGGKTNEKLVPVQEETDILTINGFVVKPEFSKKTRGEQFFFVNDRFIKSPYLNHAVTAAFDGLLPDRARASYFLYLKVDPSTIDINIHPTKTEIKFDDEHALYAMLRSTIKHSLGQFSIAPVLDFNRDSELDTPYDYKNKGIVTPKIEVDRTFNPFENVAPPKRGAQRPEFEKPSAAGWENMYEGMESQATATSTMTFEKEVSTPDMFESGLNGAKHSTPTSSSQNESSTYQLNNKYIVSTIKSGMVIIDQHRAHQRVLYEEFLRNITVKESVSQQLLFPLTLAYSTTELALIEELKAGLENTGFIFGTISGDILEINGIPTSITESQVPVVIDQLLSDLENEVPDSGFSQTDTLAKSMAKSLAVKGGVSLDSASREHLVNSLFACKEPSISPTNRKTFVTMTSEDLERKFK